MFVAYLCHLCLFAFNFSRIPDDSTSDMSSPSSTEESTGLFMLRKDSERRATLHKVLTDYISNVASSIQQSVPQVGKEKLPHCQILL